MAETIEEKIKCKICNEYEGTEKGLELHRPFCEKKQREKLIVQEVVDSEETVISQKVTEDEIITTTVDSDEQKFETTRPREEPDRTKRIPFGSPTAKLTAPDDPNFQFRRFNDNWAKEPDRIKRAEAAGYTHVEGYEPIRVGTNDDRTPIKGVLMKLPKDLYEADQALQQKEADRVDEAIQAGTLESKPGDNRYIPDGIKITSSV